MDEHVKAPARSRARYANGERRRGEIIDAATEIFAEQGYERTSLRTIAERAGTNHQTLGHHFASKEVLFAEVLERRAEQDRAERERLTERATVAEIVALMMRRNAANRAIIQLDTTLTAEAVAPDHPAHSFIGDHLEAFVSEVTQALQREQAAGRLREGLDVPVLARLLTASVVGLQTQWLYNPEIDMESHLLAYLELLRP